MQEKNADLTSYLSFWFSNSLKMEDYGTLLTQAYRIGRANNPTRPFPRDIIITFATTYLKSLIFDYAKEHDGIMHYNNKIQVFLDLAPEALAKQKELKEIMAILRDANVHFCWVGLLKIQVFYKSHKYFIYDKGSGLEILYLLHLPKPPCQERFLKRKLQMNLSPNKETTKLTKTDPPL